MISGARQILDLIWTVLSTSMVRGFFFFLIAFAVTSIGRNLPAGYRHLIWFLVILSCLVIPLVWFFLPTAQTAVQIPVSTTDFARFITAPLVSRQHYLELARKSTHYAAISGENAGGSPVWWQLWFVTIWAMGVAVLLVRGIAARRELGRIALVAEKCTRAQSYLNDLTGSYNITKQIAVLLSGQCAMPFTFGAAHSRIVLPRSAKNWTQNRLQAVLIHELAHIRYRDYLVASIARIVCTLFWFVPYIWVAYSRMVREGEKKCDVSVIDEGMRGTEYADHLVEIVHSCRGHILLPQTYPAIGRKYMLRERIENILRLKPKGLRKQYRAVGVLLVACICCLLPLLAVTCATKPYVARADEPLYGTWVNEEYANLGLVRRNMSDVKYVFADGGKFFLYTSMSDPEPTFEGRLAFDEKWTDKQGNVFYKAVQTWRWYPYDEDKPFTAAGSLHYVLYRINAAGDTLETVCNELDYPEEFSHYAGWYMIHYRQ